MRETRKGESTQSRLVAVVEFSNGHSVEYTGQWASGGYFTGDDHDQMWRAARDKATEAANATGVKVGGVEIYIEKVVTEMVERRYESRQLHSKRGNW